MMIDAPNARIDSQVSWEFIFGGIRTSDRVARMTGDRRHRQSKRARDPQANVDEEPDRLVRASWRS
jgi:hypothetical protein